ncbi:MAG: NAD(P)-dependent oxidoreductase [Firmicutes bacterium]|nr:NAD(P)-dependent oxidoreductase [Bacillota bacterium]
MKKVLVTGAAGGLGKLVIKYLLSEGKYDITALDLKNKTSHKVLKKYQRRINVIYGDITNPILMDDLVKNNDYIIHLASVKSSFINLNEKVAQEIDYKGSENIIRAITFYNPKCLLIYPSTTNVYDINSKKVSSNEKLDESKKDFYTKNKIIIENLIKDKLSNYVIYRIPTVLNSNMKEDFDYCTKFNIESEFITANDCAYALVKTIDHGKGLNKKIYNLGGGKTCISSFNYILKNILNTYGLNFKYLWSVVFLEKTNCGHVFEDSSKINNTLEYQSESIESYIMELKRNYKYRFLNRIMAKPFVYMISNKEKRCQK